MRGFLFGLLLALLAALPVIAQETNFATGPQYLMNGSPLLARSLATPTLSLEAAPLEVGASNATAGLVAGSANRIVPPSQTDSPPAVNLFPIYYGPPPASVMEISVPDASAEASSIELPASLLDTGVSQIVTAEALLTRGYGHTLAEAAARHKATAPHAVKTYTNADIDRLGGKN
jgi:hypothetical protein